MDQADVFVLPGVWKCIAGVDEVGRGPLIGPVVTAAVILDPQSPIAGLDDSKRLSEARREALAPVIRERAVAWALGRAEVEEIDTLNILHASLLAMRRAVEALKVQPDHVLVDGNRIPPGLSCEATAVVKGDRRSPVIAAASILAKVARDREMVELHERIPVYGLDRHKGYPTKVHLEAIARHGVSVHHRRSFGPVKRTLALKDKEVSHG